MLLALPLYLQFEFLLDPTTIQYPGPGDGFIVLLYLLILVPTIVGYSVFCYVSRCRNIRTKTFSNPN